MEREQYDVMFRREERHWWYAGMRRTAMAVLEKALGGRADLRVLDAGCGTGGTTIHLRRFGYVVGTDFAWEAVRPAAERGLDGDLTQGSIEHLPFGDASFDLVTSFEVVYHLGVGSDAAALAEMRRVLVPGGLLLLRLPAHDGLRGEHDRLVHTRHRYAQDEVEQKLRAAGFSIERLTWANSALFPAAAAKRVLEKVASRLPWAKSNNEAAEPDLWQPPGPINAVLESMVALEGPLLTRGVPLPFGLSILALARAV